jgi:hypothetical protein
MTYGPTIPLVAAPNKQPTDVMAVAVVLSFTGNHMADKVAGAMFINVVENPMKNAPTWKSHLAKCRSKITKHRIPAPMKRKVIVNVVANFRPEKEVNFKILSNH